MKSFMHDRILWLEALEHCALGDQSLGNGLSCNVMKALEDLIKALLKVIKALRSLFKCTAGP